MIHTFQFESSSRFQRYRMDGILIAMVSHQYIFITFARCDQKPSSLISVKFRCKIHFFEEDKISDIAGEFLSLHSDVQT